MNEKTRKILNRIFAVIAIASAICTVLLTPPVKKFLSGKKEPPAIIETTEESSQIATEATTKAEEAQTELQNIPSHTTAEMNPYKNYTLFVDVRHFDYTEEKGVMRIVAKENKNVTMVITPHRDTSYSELCEETLNFYSELDSSYRLSITADNSVYRSQSGDMEDDVITTVYCVDDGNGGSIEIVQQIPVNAQGYEESFEIFLSMFKIL